MRGFFSFYAASFSFSRCTPLHNLNRLAATLHASEQNAALRPIALVKSAEHFGAVQ